MYNRKYKHYQLLHPSDFLRLRTSILLKYNLWNYSNYIADSIIYILYNTHEHFLSTQSKEFEKTKRFLFKGKSTFW